MRRTFNNTQALCPQLSGLCHRSLWKLNQAMDKFIPWPSTGGSDLTHVPGGFPLSLSPTPKTLMSLFTKQPTPGNDINRKMQLEVPEFPNGHDSS